MEFLPPPWKYAFPFRVYNLGISSIEVVEHLPLSAIFRRSLRKIRRQFPIRQRRVESPTSGPVVDDRLSRKYCQIPVWILVVLQQKCVATREWAVLLGGLRRGDGDDDMHQPTRQLAWK